MNGEKLHSLVDRQMVIDLATEMINTPSATGEEGDMARVLDRMFREVGMSTHLQNIYDDRYNAIGRLSGTGGGPAVLMSGHMDTSVRGDEDYLIGKGWKNHAMVESDRVFGNGIMNMKNAFVSYIAGVDAMGRAGIKLKGDVIIAGTAGEIEMAPVDEFQGKHYHGYGMGLRFMLIHGVTADFHFLGEPTGQTPSTGMMGTTWAKITTHGDFSHSAFHDHSLSALDEMWLIWHELSDWIAHYKTQNTYKGVIPAVNRACLRGGLPWRAARTCNMASLYVDIRFPRPATPSTCSASSTRRCRELRGTSCSGRSTSSTTCRGRARNCPTTTRSSRRWSTPTATPTAKRSPRSSARRSAPTRSTPTGSAFPRACTGPAAATSGPQTAGIRVRRKASSCSSTTWSARRPR